jgi:hypothetical protein
MDERKAAREAALRAEYIARMRTVYWGQTQRIFDEYESRVKEALARAAAELEPDVAQEFEAALLEMMAQSLDHIRAQAKIAITRTLDAAYPPDMD